MGPVSGRFWACFGRFSAGFGPESKISTPRGGYTHKCTHFFARNARSKNQDTDSKMQAMDLTPTKCTLDDLKTKTDQNDIRL